MTCTKTKFRLTEIYRDEINSFYNDLNENKICVIEIYGDGITRSIMACTETKFRLIEIYGHGINPNYNLYGNKIRLIEIYWNGVNSFYNYLYGNKISSY